MFRSAHQKLHILLMPIQDKKLGIKADDNKFGGITALDLPRQDLSINETFIDFKATPLALISDFSGNNQKVKKDTSLKPPAFLAGLYWIDTNRNLSVFFYPSDIIDNVKNNKKSSKKILIKATGNNLIKKMGQLLKSAYNCLTTMIKPGETIHHSTKNESLTMIFNHGMSRSLI